MKPILFNTEMVRAILGGRKTVTRRAIKYSCPMKPERTLDDFIGTGDPQLLVSCAPYQTSDILWVRETWCDDWCDHIIYKADGGSAKEAGYAVEPKWRPSIHMPKEAARLFLRVTGVRVERLQDIAFGDTQDEGIWHPKDYQGREDLDIFGPFAVLWDSTIKPADLPRYGWDANPWVWVVEFERISKEAAIGGGGDG